LKTIRLYGALAKEFGKTHKFDVKSPAEAVRALQANFPMFNYRLKTGRWEFFTSRKGRTRPADIRTFRFPFGRADTMHIGPVGSVAGIEIGAAILIGALVVSAAAVTIALAIPVPDAPDPNDRESTDERASAIADRAANRIAQGHVGPVIYGEVVTGSVVVSSGVQIVDQPVSGFGTGNGTDGYDVGPGGRRYWTEGWASLNKGGKSGGGQARAAQEDPNTLQSNAIVRTIEVIGVGHNEGLVDGLKSVALDGTAVQNDDGSLNFPGFAIDVRNGDENQSYIEGFPGQEATINKGIQISQAGGPIVHTITDEDTDSARVTLRLQSLYKQDATNGDLKYHQVECDIELQSDGGGYTSIFTGARNAYFSGKCTSAYQRDYAVNLPAGGAPWDIRVTRNSGDTPAANIQDDTYLDFVTEVTDVKLNWPGVAHVGLTVNLKQLGSQVKKRSYHWRGVHIKVPTNFDPVARTYTGQWDGTFKTVYSDCPAWCLYDLATNDFYGAGQLTQGRVDPWSFYEASKYCAEQVPDGKGGMEARYRLSAVIQTRAQAIKLFNMVASVFRGAVFWGSDGLTVTQDRPELDENKPIIVPANTGEDRISYDEKESADQFSAVIVWWNNIEDGYNLTPHIEPDNDLIQKIGFETKEVTAWGAPSVGQAVRMARWELEDQASKGRNANIPVGPDQDFTGVGRIVKVHDDRYTVNSMGGRLAAATTTSLTLDRVVTTTGATFTINVIMPDGSTEIRTVTGNTVVQVDGEDHHSVLSVDSPLSAVPVVDGIWGLESDQISLRQFRVQGADDREMGSLLRAESHDPNSYARVELDINIEPETYTDLPSGALVEVPDGSISILEFQKIDGDSSVPSVRISWGLSPDPRVSRYDVEVRSEDSEGYTRLDGNDENGRDFVAISSGDLNVRVRPVDSLNRTGGWTEQSFSLVAGTQALPEVTNLTVQSDNESMQTWLQWDIPADVRPFKYEIFKGVPTDIPGAVLIGQSSRREQIITDAGSYFVRTAYMDVRSSNPAAITVLPSNLASPLWDRTIGRPLSLQDLDPAAQTAITQSEQNLITLTANLAQIDSDLTALETQTQQNLSAASANLQAQINTANGLISAAQSDITTAQGNITSIDSRVGTLETDISGKANITYVDSAISTEALTRSQAIGSLSVRIGNRGPTDFLIREEWGNQDGTDIGNDWDFNLTNTNYGDHAGTYDTGTVYEKRIIPFSEDQPVSVSFNGEVVSVPTNGEVPGSAYCQIMGIAIDETGSVIAGRIFMAGYDVRARVIQPSVGPFQLKLYLTPANMAALKLAKPDMKYLRFGVEVLRGSAIADGGEVRLYNWDLDYSSGLIRLQDIDGSLTTLQQVQAADNALRVADITALDGRIGTNETNFTALDSRVANVETGKANVTDLQNLEVRVTTAESDISTKASNSRVDTVEADAASARSSLDTKLTANIQNAQGDLGHSRVFYDPVFWEPPQSQFVVDPDIGNAWRALGPLGGGGANLYRADAPENYIQSSQTRKISVKIKGKVVKLSQNGDAIIEFIGNRYNGDYSSAGGRVGFGLANFVGTSLGVFEHDAGVWDLSATAVLGEFFRPALKCLAGSTNDAEVLISEWLMTDVTDAFEANALAQSSLVAVADEQSARISDTDSLRTRFDTISGASSQVLYNWNFSEIAEDGKPAGIEGVESINNRSQIYLSPTGTLGIRGAPDTNVAYGFPAIPIDDKLKYKIIVRHKASTANPVGLYVRMQERNSSLGSGFTHVGLGDFSYHQGRSSIKDMVSNGVFPGSSIEEDEYIYIPTAGTKFATMSFYNWSGGPDWYEIESVQLIPTIEDIEGRISASETSVTALTQSLSDETTSRVSQYNNLNARMYDTLPSTFRFPEDWTYVNGGSPTTVPDANSGDFIQDATNGRVWRRTQSATCYQKGVFPVSPDSAFYARADFIVNQLPADGNVLCQIVGIALDGNYATVGGRMFFGSIISTSTGSASQEIEALGSALIAVRPGIKFIRWGFEVIRQEVGGQVDTVSLKIESGLSTSRLTELRDVVINPDGSYARFFREVGVGSTDAFFSMEAFDNAGVEYSSVTFGADLFAIYVPADGGYRNALEVTGDRIRANVTLEAQAGIFVGPSNALWQVALRSEFFYETDGTAINFGFDLGDYDVVFFTEGLDNLASGESYVLRAINKTLSGFTADLKITSPGTPTNVTESTNATSPAGPDHMVAKANTSAASNDVYKFYGSGNIDIFGFSEGDPFGGGGGGPFEYFGSINVRVWFHDGTSWVDGGTTNISHFQLGINPNHGEGNQQYSFSNVLLVSKTWTGTIRNSASLGCFGLEEDNGNDITDLNKVVYQEQSQSGTRSATPNGELAKIQVIPK